MIFNYFDRKEGVTEPMYSENDPEKRRCKSRRNLQQ